MLGLSGPAQSEGAYTVDQLVEYFIRSADLGATRGICIGTPQECAPPEPVGLDMLVTFALASAELTPEAKDMLMLFARMMQDDRLAVAGFVVEGHTDARGGDGYNVELSELRAEAVRSHLVGLGVAPARLSAIGFGKERPRTGNALDPENRRVELRLTLN